VEVLGLLSDGNQPSGFSSKKLSPDVTTAMTHAPGNIMSLVRECS
jgi:hypothetical protein